MKNPNRKDYPPTDNGTIDFAIAVIDDLRNENVNLKQLLQRSIEFLNILQIQYNDDEYDDEDIIGSLLNLKTSIEEALK